MPFICLIVSHTQRQTQGYLESVKRIGADWVVAKPVKRCDMIMCLSKANMF